MEVDFNDEHFLDRNIRFMRRKLGLSQEELASRIGLNRGNIASYENGTAEPKICNLLKLANLFSVSIVDLTQKDLSQEPDHHKHPFVDPVFIAAHVPFLPHYQQRAHELDAVIKGLHTCYHFKIKQFEGNVPKDLQIVAMHFEELFGAAQALMNEHQSLLESLQYHLPRKA